MQTDVVKPQPSQPANTSTAAHEANRWVEDALVRDKQEGLALAVRARWIALAVIAVLLPIINPRLEVLYYEVILGLFALIGWLQLKIGRVGRSRAELALIFCDLALLTVTLTMPNPISTADWPWPMQYRFQNFIYFYILLASAVLAYSWRTVITMGIWTAVLWMAALLGLWLFFTPDQTLGNAAATAFASDQRTAELLDPNSFLTEIRIQEIVVFMIVASMLGVATRRSHDLLLSQAAAERERANLARYFSPNVVEELSHNDEPLKNVRNQNVAVLFVDIVGFTTFAAQRSPQEVIETLREFHDLMERQVFSHDGTLDKYLGDGLMATFGTPVAGGSDATNALECVRAMTSAVESWNQERRQKGLPVIHASFGLHYGAVVLGDIGANRLEFAVIGNTVNVASRLEALTRRHDAVLVVSDALVERVRAENITNKNALVDLEPLADQEVRGIPEPLAVWAMPRLPSQPGITG